MFFIMIGLFIETFQNKTILKHIEKTRIGNYLFEKAKRIKTDTEKQLGKLFNNLKNNYKNKANSYVGRKQQWDIYFG